MPNIPAMPILPESIEELAASLGINLDLETTERFKFQMSRPFKRPTIPADAHAAFAKFDSLTGIEQTRYYNENRETLAQFIKTPSAR